MTRTYGRPVSRPAARGRGGVRRAPRGFRPRGPNIDLRPLIRPLVILFVGAAAVLAAAVLLLVVLPFVLRSAISLLGVGLAPLALAVPTIALRSRQLGAGAFLRRHWRHLAGGALLFVGGMALAALFRPAASWVGVSLAEVTLGGLLGQLLLGEEGLEQALRVGLPSLAGLALVFPQTLRWSRWGFAWAGWKLHALRLPQKVGGLLRQTVAAGGGRLSARIQAARGKTPTALPVEPPPPDNNPEDWDPMLEEPVTASILDDDAPEEAAPEPAASSIQSSLLPILPEDEEEDTPPTPAWNRWELPVMDVLDQLPETETVDQTQRAKQIEEALASYGVEAKVVQIHVGPAVTQFGLEPGWDRKLKEVRERDVTGKVKLDKDGNPRVRTEEVSRTRVKVERITALSNNLALALAAPSVRIEAPVPGKQVVGIEVPNVNPSVVSLRSVIESPLFQRLKPRAKLALALGKAVAGDPVVTDLTRMPHLLIAGATGSGKSVCLNSIVSCILMHATPDDVRFLMIDPKRVELVPYNDIPHLLCPVIVDSEKVVGTLQWVIKEMDDRYRKFASVGVRNIEGYNKSPKVAGPLPYWVLVIDELADLMMVAPFEVERSLCRLAQLARATGIHLVVATQRPSVDVITGLIKANFPTRISFAVTSHIDSRTILDGSGAEKLLGRGDMLYMATDAAKPRRVQGAFVSDAEVERLVAFWGHDRFRFLRPPQFAEQVEKVIADLDGGDGEDDPLLEKARELAATTSKLSTSLLQRRLRIGYPRAARIMEALQDEGYGDDGPDDF